MQAIQIQQAKTLTYAGAIPFIVFAATALTGFERLHASYFMLAYGAVIASFLAGLHWGLYLQESMSTALNLFISSNVLTVFSWASLLIPKPLVQYSIQILCFLLLLLIDRRLYRGSKGLTTAPLCAEIIASALNHEPAPADSKLLAALDPNRFLLRKMGLKRLLSTPYCKISA